MRTRISTMAAIVLAASGMNQQAAQAQTPKGGSGSRSQPVTFTFLGITPDKQNVAYRIKVNTNKPISQVDLNCKQTDKSGKVTEGTYIWQNIVKSKQQPIVSGKTYEDRAEFYPAPAKADCSLNRVVFKDLTSWSAH